MIESIKIFRKKCLINHDIEIRFKKNMKISNSKKERIENDILIGVKKNHCFRLA